MRAILAAVLLCAGALVATPRAQDVLSGAWTLSFVTPNGAMEASATFKQDGETLTGTMSGPQGEVPLKGTITGSTFTFTIDVQTPNGQQLVIDLQGRVEGDAITGTFDFGQGMGDWTGRRSK